MYIVSGRILFISCRQSAGRRHFNGGPADAAEVLFYSLAG